MKLARATVYAPGSVGNVGPGFDVLGLAIENLGDTITVELKDRPAASVAVSGRDARALPSSPAKNVAAIAATALLRERGDARHPHVTVLKGLPLSGGLGGSAASSVGGALAAALAAGGKTDLTAVLRAAGRGEAAVSGEHYDNLAPCLFGGLTLVRGANAPGDVPEVVRLRMRAELWVATASPNVRLETREARAVLPAELPRAAWVRQMANTAALVHAFAEADLELLGRALDDGFAEPARAPLIPHFRAVKAAALGAGAIGCSISGAGPTVFALTADARTAARCALAMSKAFRPSHALVNTSRIARRGARRRK